MRTSDFDFDFPQELIALRPLPRGEARMLVAVRDAGYGEGEGFSFTQVRRLVDYLAPGDALVLNDTRVLKARLVGKNPAGARVEALLLAPRPAPPGSQDMRWEAMIKPSKRFRTGDRIGFSGMEARVAEVLASGTRLLDFPLSPQEFHEKLEAVGLIPLPPYIRREPEAADAEAYQSVFATHPGSVAAPTASLHLTPDMLAEIGRKEVEILKLTLHVGAGTFKPVQSEDVEAHAMHAETFSLPPATAEALNATRKRGGKIWAVGTTAARVLETQAKGPVGEPFLAGSGETRIFIRPGYAWRGVDGLLTNFHWPRSTLFMLVCSQLGVERARRAYAEAFARGFRLFSYGDAMLIR